MNEYNNLVIRKSYVKRITSRNYKRQEAVIKTMLNNSHLTVHDFHDSLIITDINKEIDLIPIPSNLKSKGLHLMR